MTCALSSSQSVIWLEALDLTFVILFTIEFVIKLIGLSVAETLTETWNLLDLMILLLSYVSMVLEAALETPGSGVASLRALRLLRLLRLLRAMKAFGKISGASLKTKVLFATFAQFHRVVGECEQGRNSISTFYHTGPS